MIATSASRPSEGPFFIVVVGAVVAIAELGIRPTTLAPDDCIGRAGAIC